VSPASGVLAVTGLDVVQGPSWVVREVDLAVEPGSIVALVGGPGAGKSCLIAAILGQRPVKRGHVLWSGRDITDEDPAAHLRQGIAGSPQRPPLLGGLSVEEHLRLGHLAARCSRQMAEERVMTLLPELTERRRVLPAGLDRAGRRLLDIGRALMSAPSIILLDEPALDLGEARVARLVEGLKAEGLSILLAERYPLQALGLADYGYLMVDGRIARHGQPQRLREDDQVLAACTGEALEAIAPGR
jgi:branched-chain amino acid transport system ATP-binding protein